MTLNPDKLPKSTLSRLLMAVLVHLDPKFLGEEIENKIDVSGVDKKKIKEYWMLISSVQEFYKKIQRYELYFSEFYPSSENIQEQEALEHHISAYLEDLITFRNKLTSFLGTLKHDIKKIASNSEEIEQSMSVFIERVGAVFTQVSEHRVPHRHRGMKFVDKDLIDVEIFDMFVSKDKPFKKILKPGVDLIFEKRKADSFRKAKKTWVSLAKKNSEEITGLTEEIFSINENFVYEILKIKRIEDIIR